LYGKNASHKTNFQPIDLFKKTKWNKKRYNFILDKKNYSITKFFGKFYNKDYNLMDFNNGLVLNVKKRTNLKIPFKPQNIFKLNNWEGDNLIIVGKTTMIKIVSDKVYKYKNKYSIKGNTKIVIVNKKNQRYINPKSFFKVI